jgi:hypothetical protein
MLVVEQGQRWRCSTFNPRNTIVVPYSSTQSLATISVQQHGAKDSLLFFRHALHKLRQCKGLGGCIVLLLTPGVPV